MKKTLLALALGMCATLGFAQTSRSYTDDLVVSINGESSTPQQTTIYVTTNADGTYTLALNNFMLVSGEDVAPVGNITLENIEGQEQGEITHLKVNRVINIAPGTLEGYTEEDWMGPMLGDVPVDLVAEMTQNKLHCTIAIDMRNTFLQQMIEVVFGKDIQSGIAGVQANSLASRVDVYSMNGTCIRRGIPAAAALNGLSHGIYIVNGKKVVR